jgi:2-polyprenyl-6-methoxyphenol hydroxylase-like FAD-dependent oxidoreductase
MGRDLDFVIVGGGIGGAVLANLLGRAGKQCLVVERGSTVSVPRPEVLWPATVALLSRLLPDSDARATAMLPMRGLTLARGPRVVAEVTEDDFRRAGVRPVSTNPAETRRLLLRQGPFEVRCGVEVREVVRDGVRVTGVRGRDLSTGRDIDFAARFTVGDDGAHSRVREACGVPLRLRPFPLDFLCFDIPSWPADAPGGLPRDGARVWINDRRPGSRIGALAALPFPGGRGAGLVPVSPRALDDAEALRQDWRRFSADDALIERMLAGRRFPQDLVRVVRPWGHAARYGSEGAFLIGDAVHPVSPAAGQGANMSVADAAALADVVLGRHNDPLDEYQRRRRPANERSMRFTRLAAAALSVPASVLRPIATFGVSLFRHWPQLFGLILRSAATAFQETAP